MAKRHRFSTRLPCTKRLISISINKKTMIQVYTVRFEYKAFLDLSSQSPYYLRNKQASSGNNSDTAIQVYTELEVKALGKQITHDSSSSLKKNMILDPLRCYSHQLEKEGRVNDRSTKQVYNQKFMDSNPGNRGIKDAGGAKLGRRNNKEMTLSGRWCQGVRVWSAEEC
uniref:Uncharacterized protein n=1 Tax=Oryza brachyantha TaxID=4533 RepID=J3LP67_ORYBR